MKNPFQPGDQKIFVTKVTEEKLATFDAGMVHPVYSTFALGKDAEWAGRLFVLEMKEAGEEGIGSYLSIEHLYPAPLNSTVRIEATFEAVSGNKVATTFAAFANNKKIAEGRQTQRIIQKDRFDELVSNIEVK